MRRAIATAAVLLVVQALLVVLYLRAKDEPRAEVGAERLEGAAPELAYRSASGETHRLSALRGRPVIVHFWATWCGPCREELPRLLEFADEHDDDILVLAVTTDRSWEDVRQFLGGRLHPSVVRTTAEEAQQSFGVASLPETFVVDADGALRLRFGSARDWDDRDVRRAVLSAAR